MLQCIWVKEDLKDLQKFNKNKIFLYNEAGDFFTNLIKIGFYLFLLVLYITLINFDDILSILEFSIETLKDNTFVKIKLPHFEEYSNHSGYISFCIIFITDKRCIKTLNASLINLILSIKLSTHDLLVLKKLSIFLVLLKIKFKIQR